MINIFVKTVITILVFVSFSGCGGGSSSPPVNFTPDPEVINNKTIYFESDFDTNTSLRLTANDVAIFELDNTSQLNERIPFTVSQAGNYELCMEGAGNILKAVLKDSLDQVVLEIKPELSLDCLSVSVLAQDYFLELKYVSNLIPNQDVPDATVPFIRLDEITELKDDVDTTDWDQKYIEELIRGGVNPGSTNSSGVRTCYRTPISNISRAIFRVDADNNLRLSFKPDLSQGSNLWCTYQIIFVVLAEQNIGDGDQIFAGFLNRTIVSSTPNLGSKSVSIASDISFKFRDTTDQSSIDALSLGSTFIITPAIGVPNDITISGRTMTFDPSASFTNETDYEITLRGLTKEGGTPIGDQTFSFTTEKALNLTGNETSLSNDDICTLGVTEFCSQNPFSTIQSISAEKSGATNIGSRYLKVTTKLAGELNNPSDILFEYEFIDNRDQSIAGQGQFVIGFGETAGVDLDNLIPWPIDDFEKTQHSVSMNITKISNAFGPLEETGPWTAYNGELYNSPTDVITSEVGAPTINSISLTGNISSADLALIVTLDGPALEEINIEFLWAGGCQWGINNDICLDPGVITIAAGQSATTVTLPEPDGSRGFDPAPTLTVTIANTRNVNEGTGLFATKVLDTSSSGGGGGSGF